MLEYDMKIEYKNSMKEYNNKNVILQLWCKIVII